MRLEVDIYFRYGSAPQQIIRQKQIPDDFLPGVIGHQIDAKGDLLSLDQGFGNTASVVRKQAGRIRFGGGSSVSRFSIGRPKAQIRLVGP